MSRIQRSTFVLSASLALMTLVSCRTAGDMASGTGGTAMSSAEIGSIAVAANAGEISAGELARTQATNAEVKQFAEMMVAHHTEANQKAQEWMTKRSLTAAEHAISSELAAASVTTDAALRPRSGEDFDRTYMQHQVEMHQWLLNAIDTSLMPSTRDRELRGYLTNMRATVADHLQKAQTIRATLG